MKERNAELPCGEVRSLLPAFLADELSASESRGVQEHLDACASCAGFQRFESAFDGALKRSLKREAAPASLVVRIHRALDEEDAGGNPLSRIRAGRPGLRWALAALVMLAVLGPAAIGLGTGMIRLPVSMTGVTLSAEGTLVCAECTRMARPVSQQRGCRGHGHHAALRTDNGALWEFIETDTSRPLINDADRLGDRIQVEGLFIDELQYVRVDSYHYLTSQSARLGY